VLSPTHNEIRNYLKKVFWPNLCVGPSLQILDILEYACGLKLGPTLTLNQNLFFFEIASILFSGEASKASKGQSSTQNPESYFIILFMPTGGLVLGGGGFFMPTL
jgi:hypothetical protein